MLTDPPELCGGFLVWLTRDPHGEDKMWMSGRFLSASWDPDELKARMAIA